MQQAACASSPWTMHTREQSWLQVHTTRCQLSANHSASGMHLSCLTCVEHARTFSAANSDIKQQPERFSFNKGSAAAAL
jgi:hypothetical protein